MTMTHYKMSELYVHFPKPARHWCPRSEAFAGGDCLVAALYAGWSVYETVCCAMFTDASRFGVSRQIVVYYFKLSRGDETMTMPVISNPFIRRLITDSPLVLAIQGESDGTHRTHV